MGGSFTCAQHIEGEDRDRKRESEPLLVHRRRTCACWAGGAARKVELLHLTKGRVATLLSKPLLLRVPAGILLRPHARIASLETMGRIVAAIHAAHGVGRAHHASAAVGRARHVVERCREIELHRLVEAGIPEEGEKLRDPRVGRD